MSWHLRPALLVAMGSLPVLACSGSYAAAGLDVADAGALDGSGPAPAASTPCDPAMKPACAGDDVVACVNGTTAHTTCPLGCRDAACLQLDSTTSAGDANTGAATSDGNFTGNDTLRFDTLTGKISRLTAGGSVTVRDAGPNLIQGVTFDSVHQSVNGVAVAGAPPIAVFGFASFTLGAGMTLTVSGSSVLAIATKTGTTILGNVRVKPDCVGARTLGALDARAAYAISGSLFASIVGDGLPGSGVAGSVYTSSGDPTLCGGASGGANATSGSNGQRIEYAGRAGKGGVRGIARGKSIFDMPVLAGGAAGGSWPDSARPESDGTVGGIGGLGGGAIALLSDGPIVVGGTIDAGGCGGNAAPTDASMSALFSCIGGGGGGAGGTIFFEAASVSVQATGRLLANGGAGGGGTWGTQDSRTAGAEASSTDATAARGGQPSAAMATSGCVGGSDGSPNQAAPTTCGMTTPSTVMRGSGGGGGAGIIAARTRTGQITSDSAAIVSPAILVNAVAVK